MIRILILLMAGHALCDYPLQGAFLSEAKARKHLCCPWWVALTAHALIHSGMVLLVTNEVKLSLAEFVCHWLIDWRKGAGDFNFAVDQGLHIGCKFAWALCWHIQ